MSTYYDFMVEVKYNGIWHNTDFHSMGSDGRMHHHYLATISQGFLGLLEDAVHTATHMTFDDLSESTRKALLDSVLPHEEDIVKLSHYFLLGDLQDFEKLASQPYQSEGYVTRNRIAQFECRDFDDIDDYLTAQELLELPEEARREYVLYRWDFPRNSRATVQYMLRKAHEQVNLFNDSIPRGKPAEETKASAARIIFAIS